jgi:hypothetical protein
MEQDDESAVMTTEELKQKWFRLVADENQRYLFPSLKYNQKSGRFILCVDVRKNKGVSLNFGGNISCEHSIEISKGGKKLLKIIAK